MPTRKIKVLVADDEIAARNRIKALLKDYVNFEVIGEAESGDEVVSKIISLKPDVAFLDINMPGASVFETIESLKTTPKIIFQTAYSEFATKAFDIEATDYLLKPVGRERFSKSIDKITAILDINNDTKKDVISVKYGEAIKIIKVKEILKISFEDGFSFIHTSSDSVYSDKPLTHYESMLSSNSFYRVSRNDIVNINLIEKLHPFFNGQYIVEMKNGDKVTVSRRRVKGLKQIISLQ